MKRPISKISLMVAAFAMANCAPDERADFDSSMNASTGSTSQALASDDLHMQIVAHEDDDFLFMNPDIHNAIAAGHSIASVYLTAGQASGAECGPNMQDCPGHIQMCAPEFATARQKGIKAAYAQMASVATPTWTRSLIVPDLGQTWPHTVELYTLDQAPRIKLLFMNIADGGSSVGPPPGDCGYGTYANALARMWENDSFVTTTIQPDCGPVQGFGNATAACNGVNYPDPFVCNSFEGCNPTVPLQNYDRAGVRAVLTGLINMYQPTVIRTLDPQPFSLQDGNGNYVVSYDNPDHTTAARFADEALASYHGPSSTGRSSVIHYKGYGFTSYPSNLGFAESIAKRDTAFTYAPFDPNYITYRNSYDNWYSISYERYPASTQWIERATDGRLVAAAVQDRQVKVWYENTVGGTWTGPVSLPSSAPIAPSVTLLKRPDGKLQVFAMQLPLERERSPIPAGAPTQSVITAVQDTGSGISFGAWQSLGAPGGTSAQLNGVPTAVFDGSGRAFVFAKNSDGKVSYTYSAGGTWAAWAAAVPSELDIIDGIAAIARNDGVVEVFVTGRDGRIQHFVQNGTSTAFLDGTLSFPFYASSAPTVAKNQDGRLEVFYREITDINDSSKYGRVITAWQNSSGQWLGGISNVGGTVYGDAGAGPVAAIQRGGTGHIMLFERNLNARISATWQGAPNSSFVLQWAILGGPGSAQLMQEYPSAATDNLGRAVLIVKGSDGRLYINRESSASSVGSFAGWVQIGT